MRHDAGSRGGTKASAMVFALAFLLAHAAALRWVPDAAAASFAFLIAAPLLAGLACAVRARRSGPRAEWNALALAMLLWGAGMAACMYQEEFRANSDGTPALGMLLFLLYGVPLIHLLAGQEHDVRGARLVDGLLAVALGGLFAVHTFASASWSGADANGVVRLRLMFDIENGFLLLFALLRWHAARDGARRDVFRILSLFALVYAAAAAYVNHASASDYGDPVDLLIVAPFLLLLALARWPAVPAPRRRADSPFCRCVRAASALVLPITLLVVAGVVARQNLGLAIAGFVAATLGYGLRSVLMQLHAARERERLDALTRVDALTQLANRRHFDDALHAEWNRARRGGGALALLLVDIDHFKAFNDGLGHPAGDACLREVARTLAACANRGGDVVARYGGEEFAAILPGAEPADALRVGERMRAAVDALALASPAPAGRVTVSVGVATTAHPDAADAASFLQAADAALYAAKRAGRNRVAVAGAEDGSEAAPPRAGG